MGGYYRITAPAVQEVLSQQRPSAREVRVVTEQSEPWLLPFSLGFLTGCVSSMIVLVVWLMWTS